MQKILLLSLLISACIASKKFSDLDTQDFAISKDSCAAGATTCCFSQKAKLTIQVTAGKIVSFTFTGTQTGTNCQPIVNYPQDKTLTLDSAVNSIAASLSNNAGPYKNIFSGEDSQTAGDKTCYTTSASVILATDVQQQVDFRTPADVCAAMSGGITLSSTLLSIISLSFILFFML